MSHQLAALSLALALAGSMPSGPVDYDPRWPANHIKVGRPWTKAKTRNRIRNRIARLSRRRNRQ